jgi:hypothetical protein
MYHPLEEEWRRQHFPTQPAVPFRQHLFDGILMAQKKGAC